MASFIVYGDASGQVTVKAPAVAGTNTITFPAETGTLYTSASTSYLNGQIAWNTTVQTTGFTAVAYGGYFCNTTSAAFTVTLPASPTRGQFVVIVDYAGTAATNNITINPNGGNINGGSGNILIKTNRQGLTLTYIDSTQGWLASSNVYSGNPPFGQQYTASYLVVAGGGGGGGAYYSSGGGAGGLLSGTAILTPGTVYTATVGAGGAGGTAGVYGTQGSTSSIAGTGITTISSTGGGYGVYAVSGTGGNNGGNGGSGGGGGMTDTSPVGSGGSGTPGQGNNGGAGTFNTIAGGGGGAAQAGNTGGQGYGGNGSASSITGTPATYAGGGGGCGVAAGGVVQPGGTGGGGSSGAYPSNTAATSGTANSGGGGGGGVHNSRQPTGGAGGSGVVILSVPTANYSGTTTGSPTITTSGANTIIKWTTAGSGTYTA
jgi:hypothetical protein